MLRNPYTGPALAAFSIFFPTGLAVGLAVLHLRTHAGRAHGPYWEPKSSAGLAGEPGPVASPTPVRVEAPKESQPAIGSGSAFSSEELAGWVASVAYLPELLGDWVKRHSTDATGTADAPSAAEPAAPAAPVPMAAPAELVLAAPLSRPAKPKTILQDPGQEPQPTRLSDAVAMPAGWTASWADDIGISGFLNVSAGYYPVQRAGADSSTSGVSLNDVRLIVQGGAPELRVYLSLEAVTPTDGGYFVKHGTADDLRVLDAYADLGLGEQVRLVVGQFVAPVLFSAQIQSNEILFLDRTINGFIFQERDQGVMAQGDQGRWQWWLAVQNGSDLTGDDVAGTAHVAWRVFGEGEAPRREGAFDADLGHTLYVGGVYFIDGTHSEDQAFGGEAYYTWERLGLSGEVLDYGDDLIGQVFWSLTAAYMLSPEEWELAARYENFDDRAGAIYRVGLNRYLRGYTTRLQANVGHFEGDADDDSANAFEIGLTASF